AGSRGGPGGLRLRPRGDPVRPGYRGGAGGQPARPADGTGGDPRHRSALRLHDHGAGVRAPRPAGAGASARVAAAGPGFLPERLLPHARRPPRTGTRGGPVTGPDSGELLGLAVAAAPAAAALLAARRPAPPSGRREVAGTRSSPTDVVTEMDRAAEALIRQRLLAARPGDAILGEEGGEEGGRAGGPDRVRWVVDPLDGTVNYLYGLPDWSVSIAAEVDGTVVAGVVTVPSYGEVFTATLGGGAWLHAGPSEVALRCNTGVPLEQALVSTGFGYEVPRRVVQGEVVGAVLPRGRDIRRGGSGAGGGPPRGWAPAGWRGAGGTPTTGGG